MASTEGNSENAKSVQENITAGVNLKSSDNVSTSTSNDNQLPQQTEKPNKKRLFAKELKNMMYGFGDDQNPYTETVDMLEDLVLHFIGDISLRALDVGGTGRVTVEDVLYLVRRDTRKYARVKDLLSMNEELKKARKAFDEVKYVSV